MMHFDKSAQERRHCLAQLMLKKAAVVEGTVIVSCAAELSVFVLLLFFCLPDTKLPLPYAGY